MRRKLSAVQWGGQGDLYLAAHLYMRFPNPKPDTSAAPGSASVEIQSDFTAAWPRIGPTFCIGPATKKPTRAIEP